MIPTFRVILGVIIADIAFVMAANGGLVALRAPISFGDLPDLNRPLVRSAITKRAETSQSQIMAYARRNDELHRLLDLPVSPVKAMAETVATIPDEPAETAAAEDAATSQPGPDGSVAAPVLSEPSQPEATAPTLAAVATAPALSRATVPAAEPAQTTGVESPPSELEKPEAEPSAPTTAPALAAQIAPDATARAEPPPDEAADATTEPAEMPKQAFGKVRQPMARPGVGAIVRAGEATAAAKAEAHRHRGVAQRRATARLGRTDNASFFDRLERNSGDSGRTIDPYMPANIGPAVR